MKKNLFIAIITILLISFALSSCQKTKEPVDTTNSTKTEDVISSNSEIANSSGTTKTPPTKNGEGGGEILQEKYRQCYYRISEPFALLVDKTELEEWEDRVYEEDPNETNEMVMKRFVQDLDISREDFDKANYKLAKIIFEGMEEAPMMNPKDYANQEMFELYNGDIIYTFDDEIINEYYLSGEYPFCMEHEYEEALAEGTYQTQTTDWVDVAQMEADIIAKYGSVD